MSLFTFFTIPFFLFGFFSEPKIFLVINFEYFNIYFSISLDNSMLKEYNMIYNLFEF